MTGSSGDNASSLPEPPADLARRSLPIIRRHQNARFIRIHRCADNPIWFGSAAAGRRFRPPINRFDSPDCSYGVLYAALARDGAFAESVGRNPRRFRSDEELAGLCLAILVLTRDVRLVDLHGGAAVGAIGATGVIGVGPHCLARRWAQVLHDHPESPDGIEYRCRFNSDELAVALFDRVGPQVFTVSESRTLTSDGAWLDAMRQRHQIWKPPT